MEILKIILPVFFLVWGGYLLKKVKIIKESWIHDLNGFAYYIALPAVVIKSFSNSSLFQPETLRLIGLSLLIQSAFSAFLFTLLTVLKARKKVKAESLLVSVAGNTIYMGLPLGFSVYGNVLSGTIAAVGSVMLVFSIAFGGLLAEYAEYKKISIKKFLKDFLLNPLILSLPAGIVFGLLPKSFFLAETFYGAVSMLAATASPVALVALGAFLHNRFDTGSFVKAFFASAVKLILFPVFVLVFVNIFKTQTDHAGILLLMSAMPTAATAFVVAEKYKLDKTFVANSMLVSTTLSAVTLTFVLIKLAGL